MSNTSHVFDFLKSDAKPKPVCVTFGDDPFLKQLAKSHLRDLVLGKDSDAPYATYDGNVCEWKDVIDELSTVSLFGGGRLRLAIVDEADKFVTNYRERLEDYSEKPKSTGILLLDVVSWAKTTRLYKRVDRLGLQVVCRVPEYSDRRKGVDDGRIQQWLAERAKVPHGAKLSSSGASTLLELVGPEFGLLEQALAKLSLLVDPSEKIEEEHVREIVGGWRAKTIWELIDTATAGETANALEQLDHLLQSGEHPVALFGQISWSLRRYAAATRIFEESERRNRRTKLSEALVSAGFPHWNRAALKAAEQQLMQLGRNRAGQFFQWLLETDLALKGSHSSTHRARFALESLIFRMAKGVRK